MTKNYIDSIKQSPMIDKSNYERFDLAEGIFEAPKVVVQKLNLIDGFKLASLPDHTCSLLRKKIGNFLNVPTETISVFNGSDSALEYIARMFIDKKDIVVNLVPDYSRLSGANLKNGNNVKTIELNLTENYGNSIQKIIPRLKDDTVIFISNPNNPTGRFLKKEIFEEIARRVKLVIVDEAYQEYYSIKKEDSVVYLLPKYKNIIILRSFSKYFCLAGARIGYIVADSNIIETIDKFKLRYEVSSISQELAIAALDEINSYQKYKNLIIHEKDKLINVINSNPHLYVISESVTNFVMIKHLKANLFENLKTKSVLTNLITLNSKEIYVRLCLNLPHNNNKLFHILSII